MTVFYSTISFLNKLIINYLCYLNNINAYLSFTTVSYERSACVKHWQIKSVTRDLSRPSLNTISRVSSSFCV